MKMYEKKFKFSFFCYLHTTTVTQAKKSCLIYIKKIYIISRSSSRSLVLYLWLELFCVYFYFFSYVSYHFRFFFLFDSLFFYSLPYCCLSWFQYTNNDGSLFIYILYMYTCRYTKCILILIFLQ